jgi:7-cyano-7-deazaguanine synthase
MTNGKTLAVALISGGLDSMVSAARAREDGHRLLALSIDYNQRHKIELAAARRIATMLGAERHVVLPLDLSAFGGSALTADIAVPKDGVGEGIPVTYVPARNTIFLSLALGWAEAAGARDLYIGVNALDYSGYPDCRPEFIKAFEDMAEVATKAGVEGEPFRIRAPLQHMTKAARARCRRKLVVLRSDARRPALRPVRQLPVALERVQRRRDRRSHRLRDLRCPTPSRRCSSRCKAKG